MTNDCNFSCKHCAASGKCLKEPCESTLDEIRSVIGNLIASRPVNFNIYGGEPLIRRDIIKIVDLIQQNLPGSRIIITTNGSYLRQYGRDLLERNVELVISLDGISSAVNDEIRGVGTFEEIVDNLAWFVAQKRELKKTTLRSWVAYTITRLSEEPAEILRFFAEMGVDRLIFSPIFPQGSALKNEYLFLETDALINFIERLYLAMPKSKLEVHTNQRYPLLTQYLNIKCGLDLPYRYAGCRVISTGFQLRPNGILTACPGTYPKSEAFQALGLSEPRLVESRLEDILRDEGFQKMAKLKNPGSYPNYEPCNECGFAGSYCDPCWINHYLGKSTVYSLCKRIGEILDDMHIEWRAGNYVRR